MSFTKYVVTAGATLKLTQFTDAKKYSSVVEFLAFHHSKYMLQFVILHGWPVTDEMKNSMLNKMCHFIVSNDDALGSFLINIGATHIDKKVTLVRRGTTRHRDNKNIINKYTRALQQPTRGQGLYDLMFMSDHIHDDTFGANIDALQTYKKINKRRDERVQTLQAAREACRWCDIIFIFTDALLFFGMILGGHTPYAT